MLTQVQRTYLRLKKGPVPQFWGWNLPGREKITRLSARIKDLEGLGCAISRYRKDGIYYYELKSTPGDQAILPATFHDALAKSVFKPEDSKAIARYSFEQTSILDMMGANK